MDLWWRISGYRSMTLTGADVLRTLGLMSEQVRLEKIRWESDLTVRFLAARRDQHLLVSIANRQGDRLDMQEVRGFPQLWKKVRDAPLISVFLAMLLTLQLLLPSRILFIEVDGNQTVPTARILEGLNASGVRFGVSRKGIRSEQVKNRLLSLVPELGWAGVNTKGCVATVTVRERQQAPERDLRLTGDIVAVRDGIVKSITATNGTPRCRVGDAVLRGQVLISGITDVGLCTVHEAARGEIFADTEHAIRAVLPRNAAVRTGNSDPKRKLSVIFGKKRINLYSDSGILYPSCGKMVEAIPWDLPGGLRLPVTVLIESYTPIHWSLQARSRETAEELLHNGTQRQILRDAVAAEIRREQTVLSEKGGLWQLTGTVECLEMIGRTTDGVYLEDDAKDVRASGERRTG